MASDKPRILITGITGYLGSWIGLTFLKDEKILEKYVIRGAAMDLKDDSKLKPLRDYYGEELFNKIEWVQYDQNFQEQIDEAMKGVHTLIHCAQPMWQYGPEELVERTRQSTEWIIEASKKHGVKKIILSLLYTLFAGIHYKKDPVLYHIYDEDDRPPFENYSHNALFTACNLKGDMFMDFAQKQKEEGKIYCEVIGLCTPLLKGPAIINRKNSSLHVLWNWLEGNFKGAPDIVTPLIDVRDEAECVKRAFEVEGVHGEYFLLGTKSVSWVCFGKWLSDEFSKYGYDIHSNIWDWADMKKYVEETGNFTIKIFSDIGSHETILLNTQKLKKMLGFQPRIHPRDTIIDEAWSLIRNGMVTDLTVGKGQINEVAQEQSQQEAQ